jgi:C4-dicarboxylate transporter, DctM subunit
MSPSGRVNLSCSRIIKSARRRRAACAARIDLAAAIILTVPIVMPVIAAVHIDSIHFGLVLTLNLAIGQQTPPVASVLIASCAIAKSDIWQTTKVNPPFIAALVFALLLCTYVPWISLALAHLFYGG